MAATDYFLEIEGVKGETADSKMKDKKAIDVTSFSWGATQLGTHTGGGGGGGGQAAAQDLHFTKTVDAASPTLMLFCATGQHIKKSTLSVRKAGGKQETYMQWTMSDCLISSFQIGGGGGEVLPTEQVSLNFAEIEFGYAPQKADGSLDTMDKKKYNFRQRAKT